MRVQAFQRSERPLPHTRATVLDHRLGLLPTGAWGQLFLAGLDDETSKLAQWVCPRPHSLEAWDDSEPLQGVLSLTVAGISATRIIRGNTLTRQGIQTFGAYCRS